MYLELLLCQSDNSGQLEFEIMRVPCSLQKKEIIYVYQIVSKEKLWKELMS